jgi:serine/threonine protein kinase
MATTKSIISKNLRATDSIVPLPVGSRLHEYEILGVVGEGGFGVVYHGVDKRLEREVAIKEFMPSMWASRLEDGSVVCRSEKHKLVFETALAGFINEARLLARFKHPALVQVLHFWEQSGTAYMVMPLYRGKTIKQMVKQNPDPITQTKLFSIIESLMGALEVLHLENCYHRDLSPDNVIILEDGSPILLDFGAARRTVDDVDQTFTVVLKPGYAPVEQYANDSSIQQGSWTDIYGLASLCYFVITKQTPTTSVTRLMRDQLKPLAEQNLTGFDQTFLKSIDWGMAVQPQDRPQSIAEFRERFHSDKKITPSLLKVPEKPDELVLTTDRAPEESLFNPTSTEFEQENKIDAAVAQPSKEKEALTLTPVTAESNFQATNKPHQKEVPSKKISGNWKIYAVVAVLFFVIVLGSMKLFFSSKSDDGVAQRQSESTAVISTTPTTTGTEIAPNLNKDAPNPDKTPDKLPNTTAIIETPKTPQLATTQDSLGPKEAIVTTPPQPTTSTSAPSLSDANTIGSTEVDKSLIVKGFVQINVNPWGKVYVDGVYVGVTPPLKRLPLEIGPHKITIRNEGFPDATQTVTVKPEQSVKITHDFN